MTEQDYLLFRVAYHLIRLEYKHKPAGWETATCAKLGVLSFQLRNQGFTGLASVVWLLRSYKRQSPQYRIIDFIPIASNVSRETAR